MATKQEQDFLDMIEGWSQENLVKMIRQWVFFGELPDTTISQTLKENHSDYDPNRPQG